MFNPNSQNQRWSKWVWFVQPGTIKERPFDIVKHNIARFGRKAFGSGTEMRIRQTQRGYIVEVLTEGVPGHGPDFQKYMREKWDLFFQTGFGPGTTIRMTAKLMAGRRQDGSPAEQLIILPTISIGG